MKSNKNILSKSAINECTSCQFCESICPVNAISFSLNETGFYSPEISDDCIECGLCQKYCYKFQSITVNEDVIDKISCYAVKSKDKNILNTSASGGVSTILFKNLLNEDYKIVGVTFNIEKNRAETIIIEKKDELEILKGSKYMQSRSENIFREMMNNKNKYAVIGTPCSIYPIHLWAHQNNQEDRFLFLDFFCHGTPSMLLWKKYSDSYLKKGNIKNIVFRSKHYGWHEFCHEFIFDDMSVFSSITEKDPFFTLFFDNQILNLSCYGCKCRNTFEYCDIRIGDFWGSNYDHDYEGVSVVVLVSDKGKKVFKDCNEQLIFKKEKFDKVILPQAYKKEYIYDSQIRDTLLSDLKSSDDISSVFNNYLHNYPIKKKIKRHIKIFIKKLPLCFLSFIRSIYHNL